MKLAFNLVDWQARAPGLTDAERWQEWATLPPVISATAELAKSTFLPMMTARRLASGFVWPVVDTRVKYRGALTFEQQILVWRA